MNRSYKFFLVCFLILLFCCNAFALLVSINPKEKTKEPVTMYVDELREFELIILNPGNQTVQNLNLKIAVDAEATIVEEDQESNEIVQLVESIKPNESNRIFFTVKAKKQKEKVFIKADYGFEVFTHVTATYLKIVEDKLLINASLLNQFITGGGENNVLLSLENNSEETIKNIKAELIVPRNVENKSTPLLINTLDPKEKVEEKAFLFSVDPIVKDEKTVKLRITFDDSNGKHVIEKDFTVKIVEENPFLIALAILVLLVLIALIIKPKIWKKKEATSNKAQ